MNPNPADPVTFLGLGLLSWDGIATIVAALVAAAVAVAGYVSQQSRARKDRLAITYSEALRAVEDYLEAPYLVRRRDGSSASRQLIATHISEVQSRLSFYSALLSMQAPDEVSATYRDLVATARAEAGQAMSHAWRTQALRKDRDVPIGRVVDRSKSDSARTRYLEAIRLRQ